MRIAVIGAGAMGSIYGGHLSLKNEVYLVDTNQMVVDAVNREGLKLEEQGNTNLYKPAAVTDTAGLAPMDLIILFVKAMYSHSALESNRHLIGENTVLMTLQNGAGHEDILREFVPRERIVIGTTEDNGAVLAPGHVRHGGEGKTNIGMLVPDSQGILPRLQENFNACGFQAKIHENIQQLIWNKLFTNVSLSACTAVLQCKMGYIASDPYAWKMTASLLHEACMVARALGLEADEEALAQEIRETSERSPEGVTSICADLSNGRRTEVETISGAVVRAAKSVGVAVPVHEFLVNMVHALEDKSRA